MKKKLIIVIFLIIILLSGGYIFWRFISVEKAPGISQQTSAQSSDKQSPGASDIRSQYQPAKEINKLIDADAPFVVQAPFQNWDDPIFQNACDEASIVMAMGWINGVEFISPEEAQKQILDIVDFENSAFGYNTDTDTMDVEKIFKIFFQIENVSVGQDIAMEDIKNELQAGNLVITPMFGQDLGNPYYVSPGPVAHMLVITGYDPKKKEFITNDPGTKRGSGYRYTEKVLFDAIWEYPSGKDAPPAPTGARTKAMVVVRK